MAGIHRDTLLRWLREKRVAEPARDRNGWRAFTLEEAETVMKYADVLPLRPTPNGNGAYLPFADSIGRLEALDWDFAGAKTGFLPIPSILTQQSIFRKFQMR
jgi:site-specific DNA-methyltransferase (cytosine-N4-specific)